MNYKKRKRGARQKYYDYRRHGLEDEESFRYSRPEYHDLFVQDPRQNMYLRPPPLFPPMQAVLAARRQRQTPPAVQGPPIFAQKVDKAGGGFTFKGREGIVPFYDFSKKGKGNEPLPYELAHFEAKKASEIARTTNARARKVDRSEIQIPRFDVSQIARISNPITFSEPEITFVTEPPRQPPAPRQQIAHAPRRQQIGAGPERQVVPFKSP